MVRVSVLALLLLTANSAAAQNAGKYNRKIAIGSAAPTFTDLPGIDGKTHSLADFTQDVLVVCITCNHCPVAVAYEDRVNDFARKHATASNAKLGFIAICVNLDEEDRLPKMRERAKEKGFTFPYLHDATQKIGRQFGASVTPEFFVLNKERKVVYMGRMDDNSDARAVKTNYLEPAVAAALQGTAPAIAETRALGCGIPYRRSAGE